MKKTLFFSVLLLGAGACVKNTVPEGSKIDLEAIETLADYEVPTRAGMATIVTLGDDTLAVTTQAVTAKVPRYAKEQGLLNVTYSDEQIYMEHASMNYWQYLAFEDTRSADYDYNDIVFHVRLRNDKVYGQDIWNNSIDIQPVALGSSVPIKIGILYAETGGGPLISRILVEDARKELFNGDPRFPINTDPNKEIKQVSRKLTNFFRNTTPIPLRVVWFIEANGVRLYAATSQVDDKSLEMVSKDGLPYGISLTKKWEYPIEKVSIDKTYPAFREWVKTGNESTLLSGKNDQYAFPACRPVPGVNGSLWDYDK